MKLIFIAIAVIAILIIYRFLINTTSSSEFVMYHADWCHHCQTAKPEFLKLQDSYHKIPCKLVNEKEITTENIEGFPTFILYKNNKKIIYEGNRTLNDFILFLNKHNI